MKAVADCIDGLEEFIRILRTRSVCTMHTLGVNIEGRLFLEQNFPSSKDSNSIAGPPLNFEQSSPVSLTKIMSPKNLPYSHSGNIQTRHKQYPWAKREMKLTSRLPGNEGESPCRQGSSSIQTLHVYTIVGCRRWFFGVSVAETYSWEWSNEAQYIWDIPSTMEA